VAAKRARHYPAHAVGGRRGLARPSQQYEGQQQQPSQ
jgi:hypothetical protein